MGESACCPALTGVYEISSDGETYALTNMNVDNISAFSSGMRVPDEQPVQRARQIFASIPRGEKRCRRRILPL